MKTVAIFCHGQKGDALTITSVLKYREKLWGDAKLVWYIADENADLLKYQDIEVRTFPRGFGYPAMVETENKKNGNRWEDWAPLVDNKNHLNLKLKQNYLSLSDIDMGYFPAPHQMTVENRHGIEYPNISKKVFGIPDDWEWHPVIKFSKEERALVNDFIDFLPAGKNIAIETFGGSGQSRMSDWQVRHTMNLCRKILGDCNFIFVSHKYLYGEEKFPDDLFIKDEVFPVKDFSIRECALVVGRCDMMVSVSSGITVAASCWGNNPTPIIQFCGSRVCSTKALALGRFELVTADFRPMQDVIVEYEHKLVSILNNIK